MPNRKIDGEKSIRALTALLKSIVNLETKIVNAQETIIHLKSQTGLTQISYPDLPIEKMSLNTLKRNAECYLEGGFAYLEQLRHQALFQLIQDRSPQASPKTTKQDLRKKNIELEQNIDKFSQDLILVTKALFRALEFGSLYADRSGMPEIIEMCIQNRTEILAMLRKKPNCE